MLVPLLAGLTLSAMALMHAHQGSKVHDSLANAERTFAERCRQVGVKKSFLEAFHPRGIFFAPHPQFAVDDLKRQPDDPVPASSALHWAPQFVDVAAGGDLGYTTGPFKVTRAADGAPPTFGQYFSVWQRRHDGGEWQVVLDFTTSNLQDQIDPKCVGPQVATPPESGAVRPGASPNEITDMESRFSDAVRNGSVSAAFARMASPAVRVHRSGTDPQVGIEQGAEAFSKFRKISQWTPRGSGISKTGDLGYSYGRYVGDTGRGPVAGYWARVWKRNPAGVWKVVADIANVEPAS